MITLIHIRWSFMIAWNVKRNCVDTVVLYGVEPSGILVLGLTEYKQQASQTTQR